MKKLIALLLCALVLSACGNTDEKTSDTGTVSSTVSETETAKGKYKKAITTDSAGATVSTTEYEYDSDGNVTREAVTYASGESEVTVYEYVSGRLQRKTLTTSGNSTTTSTVEYIYDGDRVTAVPSHTPMMTRADSAKWTTEHSRLFTVIHQAASSVRWCWQKTTQFLP